MLYSPQVKVVFYQEPEGTCPVLDFLQMTLQKAQEVAQARIQMLAARGHQLRRPHADYLEDGIYELRWHMGRVQHRILYSFHGRGLVVLLHALTKEGSIPRADLSRARQRKLRFEANPAECTKVFST